DAAAKIVASANVKPNQRHAYLTLGGCGAVGANAFATGIAKLASVTDTVRLDDFMSAADNWGDASVYNAAAHLANNTSATPQARVFAIRHLIGLVNRYTRFGYGGLVAAADTTLADGTRMVSTGCEGGFTSAPSGTIVATPLPSNAADQIRATLAGLVANQSAPKQVRAAAACLVE
ncbi:MAG TPA: hypothetical protein VFZ21_09190, partial [Gemmatimonadaceae bacterium]|nr:hypothetical protein [Gemmatimonadaceae bacterium]